MASFMHIKWGQIPCRSSSDLHTTLGEESYSERIPKLSGVCKWGWQPQLYRSRGVNKGNNKITELRTILQRESQNS